MNNYKLSVLGKCKNGLNFPKHTVVNPCKIVGIPDFANNVTPAVDTLGYVDMRYVSSEYLLKNNDILFVRSNGNKNLVGRTMIIENCNEPITFSGFCIRFRPDTSLVDPYYLLYLLKSPMFREKFSKTHQTNINNINQDTIGNCSFDFISIDEQRRIANAVSILDKKISVNNRINAELERTARTIYEYMFLQGERSGWQTDKLNTTSLCDLINTGVDRFDGEKIYLSTSEISGEEITDHTITIDYATRPSRANMQPQMHSVWFAKMKNTVKHLLVNEGNTALTTDYLLSTGFAGFKCKPNTVYYLWNYICGDYFEMQKDTLATGATQQAINDTDLASFSILVPPQAELDRFTQIVEPYYRLINKNKFENKALAEQRDFLLPLLMNGQVTVAIE